MPAKLPYFQYDWKKEQWNLFFVAGIVLGSALAVWAFPNPSPFQIAAATQADLETLGIRDFQQMMPVEVFGFSQLFTLKGLIFGVIGGFLVGFGTRYAGGCTSGHAIMGLSNLQWPSLVATISFMAGGFFCTWVLLPVILGWVMG